MEIRDADEDLGDEEFPDEGTDEISQTRPCPSCGSPVYELSDRCPNCGFWIPADRSSRRSLVVIVIAILAAAALLFALLR
ncbi:MAG: hypothetical protein V2A58_05700 [Planctomycetota bacterium]